MKKAIIHFILVIFLTYNGHGQDIKSEINISFEDLSFISNFEKEAFSKVKSLSYSPLYLFL